jgi:quercetin dioxygenase-like cupin family protein
MRLVFADETARLRAEQAYVEGDRNARTLAKAGAFRLVLVTFRSGALFDERDQRGSLALQVLEGRLEVRVDKETVQVGEAEVAVVTPGHPWTAVALADGVLLIHLAWPPEPASASKV